MIDKVQYISIDSFNKLKKELEDLKNIRIPEIANRIDEAKQQGDLSENAEYHQAKEDMAWAQGRSIELDQLLNNAEIIAEPTNTGVVTVGQTIIIESNGKSKEFTIVGPQEANPLEGRISNESPLGEAFLGHKANDEIEVKTPAGTQRYKIISIK